MKQSLLAKIFGIEAPEKPAREVQLERENLALRAAYKTLKLGVQDFSYGKKALRKSEFYLQDMEAKNV